MKDGIRGARRRPALPLPLPLPPLQGPAPVRSRSPNGPAAAGAQPQDRAQCRPAAPPAPRGPRSRSPPPPAHTQPSRRYLRPPREPAAAELPVAELRQDVGGGSAPPAAAGPRAYRRHGRCPARPETNRKRPLPRSFVRSGVRDLRSAPFRARRALREEAEYRACWEM